MRTPKRAREWQNCTKEASDDFLYPIKDNDTRQFSIYMMLVRAVTLKDTISIFVARNIVSDKDGKNLSECIMSREDQQYYSNVIAFMKPLFLLVKDLEGKPELGAYGFIVDVLPAFDYIEQHLKRQLVDFASQSRLEDGVLIKSIAYINCLNAMAKLDKY